MFENSYQFITAGIVLGLSAGFSPGPLFTLVLAQTIKHNSFEGIKVAISPLITDLPILLSVFWIYNKFSKFHFIIALISFSGGFFLAYLGIESLKVKGLDMNDKNINSGSIKKGIITNFLSPNPYLFWTAVGIPLLFKAYENSFITAALFLFSFYTILIGSKVIVAMIAGRAKMVMNQKIYIIIMRILGFFLLVFSLMFFYDSIKHLLMYNQ